MVRGKYKEQPTDALLIIGLPDGPTAHFKLSRLVLRKDIKDIAQEAVKKRRRGTKPYSRSIVGTTLEVIWKKRSEKPEVCDATRKATFWYAELTLIYLITIMLS
ncbi:hypothetical protein FNV43_RR15500 [Rhamnella rubrinervis]|uniref:Uncharacterized protein n=1 Tax=Rhamnella rubrinervis TaxID=2594499 RepID=A0A8K0E7H3_9ROSA|nr:hypothetical protein FNV43_RR15500 [Rhamnella rubrinervis]